MQNSELYKRHNKTIPQKLNFYIYAIAFSLGLSNIIFSNILATKGVELSYYLNETKKTNQQIGELKNQLYYLSSLYNIEEKATRMGFSNIKNTITITKTTPQVASIQP